MQPHFSINSYFGRMKKSSASVYNQKFKIGPTVFQCDMHFSDSFSNLAPSVYNDIKKSFIHQFFVNAPLCDFSIIIDNELCYVSIFLQSMHSGGGIPFKYHLFIGKKSVSNVAVQTDSLYYDDGNVNNIQPVDQPALRGLEEEKPNNLKPKNSCYYVNNIQPVDQPALRGLEEEKPNNLKPKNSCWADQFTSVNVSSDHRISIGNITTIDLIDTLPKTNDEFNALQKKCKNGKNFKLSSLLAIPQSKQKPDKECLLLIGPKLDNITVAESSVEDTPSSVQGEQTS